MKTVNPNQWTRREFTVQSVLTMLSGVAITLSSCGGDSNSSTAPSTTSTTSTTSMSGDNVGVVGANHGHTAVITAAQLTAANAVSLDISGSADHPHTVNLTDTEVGQIAGGTRVQKASSNDDGHAHTVTFN